MTPDIIATVRAIQMEVLKRTVTVQTIMHDVGVPMEQFLNIKHEMLMISECCDDMVNEICYLQNDCEACTEAACAYNVYTEDKEDNNAGL